MNKEIFLPNKNNHNIFIFPEASIIAEESNIIPLKKTNFRLRLIKLKKSLKILLQPKPKPSKKNPKIK